VRASAPSVARTTSSTRCSRRCPPVAATVDSGVAGYVALARLFLPRARALAARTGAAWPEAYERASVGYFERMLGVSLDLRPGHAEDSDRQRGR
jgi:hypothetical protein